ncbi:MAG: NTP transferase domain-containing protein [Actinobacteria bacterium]|nr:NTP transferase domain-containing protein [Actinomycetota bacterium]
MDYSKDLSVIILAAGKGKRMKSETPKVLHHITGKPIIYYILSKTRRLNARNVFVVTGYKSKLVENYLFENFPEVIPVYQERQLGTADAVRQVFLQKKRSDFGKYILVMIGDCPLISLGTLKSLVEQKLNSAPGATILTTEAPDPFGYGRVIMGNDGRVQKIIEEQDAGPREKLIKEINASFYCFDTDLLMEYISLVGKANSQEEYYLTDMVEILIKNSKEVNRLKVRDQYEVMGINDRKQLEIVQELMNSRIFA